MKLKIIAVAVSGLLVAACSDNKPSVVPELTSTSLQAFDGAVRHLDTFINCGDGEEFVAETGGGGFISLGEGNFPAFDADPSACTFTFKEDANFGSNDAIDESNGKDMTKVVYRVPSQLINAGEPIAATPYTTLISKKIEILEEAGEEVTLDDLDKIIDEVFTETLPVGTVLTAEQKLQLLNNPQAALDNMDEETSKNVQASTIVLSDALVAQPDASPEQLQTATQKTATVLAADPDFPTKVDESTGETVPTYVDLTDLFEKDFETISDPEDTSEVEVPDVTEGEVLPPAPPTEIEPVEPPPATGGTGGTGGTGSN